MKRYIQVTMKNGLSSLLDFDKVFPSQNKKTLQVEFKHIKKFFARPEEVKKDQVLSIQVVDI